MGGGLGMERGMYGGRPNKRFEMVPLVPSPKKKPPGNTYIGVHVWDNDNDDLMQ